MDSILLISIKKENEKFPNFMFEIKANGEIWSTHQTDEGGGSKLHCTLDEKTTEKLSLALTERKNYYLAMTNALKAAIPPIKRTFLSRLFRSS
jgi:hypothetical protein